MKHLNRNELDKPCFTHDVVDSDSKGMAKRTISDKILKDRVYEIARNRNSHGYLDNHNYGKVFDKKEDRK